MHNKTFDPRLESMRGIAAMIVAVHHGMSAFVGAPFWTDWLLWPTNPGGSVFFFFVLSGYVLGRSLEREPRPFIFIVRRVFRIGPALVAAVLFAFVVETSIIPSSSDNFSSFFWKMTSNTPSVTDLIENLTLRGSAVNGPTWSLYPEAIGSLLLSALVPLHRFIKPQWQVPTFLAISAILSFSLIRYGLWFYMGFFLPGRLAGLLRQPLSQWISLIFGLALLRYISTVGELYKFNLVFPSAIAGVMIIAPVLSNRSFLVTLEHGAFRFLGRISYSFYLFHWPVFYATAFAAAFLGLHGQIGNITVCAASVVVAILLASGSYRLIELPMIRVGKLVTPSVASDKRLDHPAINP